MYRFCFFSLHSLIVWNKQHDIQCLHLIKIMSKSKMKMATADVMLNHPNASFSWFKPAAAIEATISTLTDGARTYCLLQSLSLYFLFPLLVPPPQFMTKSLHLQVWIFFEHYVSNIKTHHNWIAYWLISDQKRKIDVVFEYWLLLFCHNMQWILFSHQ